MLHDAHCKTRASASADAVVNNKPLAVIGCLEFLAYTVDYLVVQLTA